MDILPIAQRTRRTCPGETACCGRHAVHMHSAVGRRWRSGIARL